MIIMYSTRCANNYSIYPSDILLFPFNFYFIKFLDFHQFLKGSVIFFNINLDYADIFKVLQKKHNFQ
jgi:hypothetical protein